jgi:hypothetical protein
MAIDPEAFYVAMPKPNAPNDRMLVQSRLVVEAPQPSAPATPRGPDEAEAAARRFYGQEPAQDRVQPATGNSVVPKPEATQRPSDDAQREHEQRRQEEVDLAERMFGGTPMDGVRYDEVELTSLNEFSLDVPEDLAANLGEGEAQQIVSSFIEAGVGRTFAVDLVRQGVEASRRGPLSDDQVQRRNTDGMAALREKWGSQTGAKIELARGMIAAAEAKWPGVKAYLNATGMGSDPKLIQQLVARAERRPGRR